MRPCLDVFERRVPMNGEDEIRVLAIDGLELMEERRIQIVMGEQERQRERERERG